MKSEYCRSCDLDRKVVLISAEVLYPTFTFQSLLGDFLEVSNFAEEANLWFQVLPLRLESLKSSKKLLFFQILSECAES